MTYNFINGRFIIAKIYDEFNIKSNDWESRAPRWIMDALQYLNIKVIFEEVVEEIEFDNYTFNLPVNVRLLRGIVLNNTKLNRVNTVSHKITNSKVDQYTNNLRNYSIDNGKVHLEQKSGKAIVVYARIPLDWDDELGMWIPRVPDVVEVQENITWYVLKLILARGYIHPIYSLTSNRAELNPDYNWKATRKAARLAAGSMDVEARASMAEVLSRFLNNPHADIDELFNTRR